MDLSVKMRSILFLSITLMLNACNNTADDRTVGTDNIESPATLNGDSDDALPRIKFDQTEFNTGKITQGEVKNFKYNFKNTGKAPLVISEVNASCGCTVARNYPKGKIMPGEGGTIEVEFDSDNKWGKQTVAIDVATNAIPAFTQLLIRTEIVVPDNMKTNK